jgi:opacity protein-like surface antigen
MNTKGKSFKVQKFLLLFGLIVGLVPSSVDADSGLYLKAYGGLNFTSETPFETADALSLLNGGDVEYDTGQAFGISAGYRMQSGLALELDYSYRSNDLDSVNLSALQLNGDLESVGLLVNLVYYPAFGDLLSPYFGVGLGALQEIDASISINENQFGNFDGSAFAWQAFLGLNISALDNLSVFSELRFFSGPGPELSNDLGSIDLDYNNVSLIFGLNFSLT